MDLTVNCLVVYLGSGMMVNCSFMIPEVSVGFEDSCGVCGGCCDVFMFATGILMQVEKLEFTQID